MKEYKVPIQSLIDHIKTAVDVDPWAKEMAEELLKEQPDIVRCKDCRHRSDKMYDYYGNPNNKVYVCQINDLAKKPDWFCADGERKEGR